MREALYRTVHNLALEYGARLYFHLTITALENHITLDSTVIGEFKDINDRLVFLCLLACGMLVR